ncbi:hypothetical protein PR048_014810 [Dryococelus australis]|uniref:Uncharacterized protein n=1 Tax=Dryococelus australis TaxID=614101 RepID=A0ABQ9HF79_9NEOP|nr:hypothetical protein PR048_014810 [Dryococelus australis]
MPRGWCLAERGEEVAPSFLECDRKGRIVSEASSPNSDSYCNEMNLQSRRPSVWTEVMWNNKRDALPWIDCKNGRLGCKLCSEVSCRSSFKNERIAISKEWHSYNVTYNVS